MFKALVKFGYKTAKDRELELDEDISSTMLAEFFLRKLIQFLRGVGLGLIHFKPLRIFCGKNVSLRYASRVKIGAWSLLDDGVVIDGFGKNGVSIGRSCTISAYSRLVASVTPNALGVGIEIGDHVGIGEFSRIGGSGGVKIGKNTHMAQYLSIHPENHKFDQPDKDIIDQGTIRAPIVIGENCWIGAKVTILAGVHIGDNCVIGAGSIVTKSIPRNSIAVGVPAKVVGSVPSRNGWNRGDAGAEA